MNILPKLPPLIAAATMIGCCSCSTHRSHVPDRPAFVRQRPGETDRGAIIDSERRFDRLIVRDSVPAPAKATADTTAVSEQLGGDS